MGSYTSTQKLYRTDANEVVDVESQLNSNLRRLDSRVRSLVEYQHVSAPSITGSVKVRENGMKWFKTSTNALWVCKGDYGKVYQNSQAYTEEWTSLSNSQMINGWQNISEDAESFIGYQKDAAGIVSWRGRVRMGNYLTWSLETMYRLMQPMPAEVTPTRAKYFSTIVGGWNNQALPASVARIYVGSNGNFEFNLMGEAPGPDGDTNNWFSLNDVWYSTDD